jgi:hypothetical protein
MPFSFLEDTTFLQNIEVRLGMEMGTGIGK